MEAELNYFLTVIKKNLTDKPQIFMLTFCFFYEALRADMERKKGLDHNFGHFVPVFL
jgi:hypothetical protein